MTVWQFVIICGAIRMTKCVRKGSLSVILVTEALIIPELSFPSEQFLEDSVKGRMWGSESVLTHSNTSGLSTSGLWRKGR